MTRIGDYTFKITPEDMMYCYGVEFGGIMRLFEINGDYLLIHKAGKTVYLQRCNYVYSQPTYYIFKIERKYKDSIIIRLEGTLINEFKYNRQNKKEIYKQTVKYFRGLK